MISETMTDEMVSAHQQQTLANGILRWSSGDGITECALPGVHLIRADQPTATCNPTVYEPSIAFLIQGRKTVHLGDREIVYHELSYLTTSVALPVLGHVVEASPQKPYLAIKLKFTPQEVADMILQAQINEPMETGPLCNCGLQVAAMEPDLLDALTRLRDNLDGCIGCGCLSLDKCKLYNPEDEAAALGAGPRYLMGDTPQAARRV